MLLLQVSDFLINEQHEARVHEAEANWLARTARSAPATRRSQPSPEDHPIRRGPRLASRVSRLVGRSAGI